MSSVTKDNFADATSGLLNVKQINTTVLLDNGETVVIGGIYEQDRNDTVTQIPFLGDIPLLGWLFKSKEFKDNKTELLIFITPRILAQQAVCVEAHIAPGRRYIAGGLIYSPDAGISGP